MEENSLPLKVGRPPLRDWQSERQQIEQFIAKGWGISKIARFYDMSAGGARKVCQRLSLKTRYQQ